MVAMLERVEGSPLWIPNCNDSFLYVSDEETAKEEVMLSKELRTLGYAKADVVVAMSGWDSTAARPTAEGALRALKYLLVAEKDLPGNDRQIFLWTLQPLPSYILVMKIYLHTSIHSVRV
jgi:hypothetical protein